MWTAIYRRQGAVLNTALFATICFVSTKSCTPWGSNHQILSRQDNNLVQVIKREITLTDNGTQFQPPSWKQNLARHGILVRISAIRHPQSNSSERCMGASSKLCRIYSSENHRKWGELLPYIERWLNNTVTSSTSFAPVGLMYNEDRPNLFEQVALNCQRKPLFRNLRTRFWVHMQDCRKEKNNWKGKRRTWN